MTTTKHPKGFDLFVPKNILNSADIIRRLKELEAIDPDELTRKEKNELDELMRITEYACDFPGWEDGIELINDFYLTEHTMEAVKARYGTFDRWLAGRIDWECAVNELIEFDCYEKVYFIDHNFKEHTYWIRVDQEEYHRVYHELNQRIGYETASDATSASTRALLKAWEGVWDVVKTLESDFSEVERYKDIDVCTNAFERVKRALREATAVVSDEKDSVIGVSLRLDEAHAYKEDRTLELPRGEPDKHILNSSDFIRLIKELRFIDPDGLTPDEPYKNVLNSTNFIRRIDELEATNPDELTREKQKEFDELASVAYDCRNLDAWEDGADIVHESYFPEYARELAKARYGTFERWLDDSIDWDGAGRDLQWSEYQGVKFMGHPFWVQCYIRE